jgi:hypothetical protein
MCLVRMLRSVGLLGWVGMVMVLGACGPSSAHTTRASTANPGGGTVTTLPTSTPTPRPPPPIDTPVPALSSFAGMWSGTITLGSATTLSVAADQCGSSVYAAFAFNGAAPEVALGPANGGSATLTAVVYRANAPVDNDTWTITLAAGNALTVALRRQPLGGGSAQSATAALALTSMSVAGAPNYSGTWNGNENFNGDTFPIRFVIDQCGPFLNVAIYLSQQGGTLPATPQSNGNTVIVNGGATLETTVSVSGSLFEYDRWGLTLPSANDLHFTDYTHYLYPGNTNPDQNADGDANR